MRQSSRPSRMPCAPPESLPHQFDYVCLVGQGNAAKEEKS